MVYKAVRILLTIIEGLPLEIETPVVKLHPDISHKLLSKNIALHVFNDCSFSRSLEIKHTATVTYSILLNKTRITWKNTVKIFL